MNTLVIKGRCLLFLKPSIFLPQRQLYLQFFFIICDSHSCLVCFQTRSTGRREKMLLLSTLRSWSPCCSGRILWSGWALVRWNTKRKREKEGKNPTHGTAGNSVRARQTQRATINSHVTAGATSVLLISLSRQGRNWGTAEQFILWPPHLFPLINLQLFPSPVCESGSMHDQAPRVCCSVDCKNGRGTKVFNHRDACMWLGAGTAAPPYSSRSPIARLSFTKAAALP